MKKYKFTGKTKTVNGILLQQIELLVDLPDFPKGSVGGWIESEENLSHKGTAWVTRAAHIWGATRIFGEGL